MTSRKKDSAKPTAPAAQPARRIGVLKTYKLYINGGFPRTESGRYSKFENAAGECLANICRASRKDVREAVSAAREAQGKWASRAAMNRGQILYRCAETLEGRREQFIAELVLQGMDASWAALEVDASIDRLVYYAGWCDKIQQVFGTVNPVSSSHFNFSMLEPTGVVCALAPDAPGLLGLASLLSTCLAGGNTLVVLASETFPLTAITFAEVLAASDVPPGVVNILTGHRKELAEHMARHMDVNALLIGQATPDELCNLQTLATDNVKRVSSLVHLDWNSSDAASPYRVLETMETKTTWHPIGV